MPGLSGPLVGAAVLIDSTSPTAATARAGTTVWATRASVGTGGIGADATVSGGLGVDVRGCRVWLGEAEGLAVSDRTASWARTDSATTGVGPARVGSPTGSKS